MMIVRIPVVDHIIIIKSEVWPICHCLGLGHETMECAVCLSVFLFPHLSRWSSPGLSVPRLPCNRGCVTTSPSRKAVFYDSESHVNIASLFCFPPLLFVSLSTSFPSLSLTKWGLIDCKTSWIWHLLYRPNVYICYTCLYLSATWNSWWPLTGH